MIRTTRLAAAFALAAGLTAAGPALAQTQTAGTAPPAQSTPTQSTLPSGTLPSAQPQTPAASAWDANTNQPTYAVDPPPEGSSGIYLPAVVGGYAKSVAGCIVIGCEDGPRVGGDSGSASSAPATPPPANPGSSDSR